MVDVGAVFLPQFAPESLRPVAEVADAVGLSQLWLWEDCFKQGGMAMASAALASTTRLQVGVGIFPVPLRNVALTAMELAAVHRLFPGRALLGVGHGVQDWMGQVGARVESPLTLLREHLEVLRRLLDGEQVTFAGRYVTLDQVALDWPPPQAPVLLAAGEGPRTLELTGTHADGTILTGGSTPQDVARARQLVDAARAGAGRNGPHPVTVFVMATGGPGAQQRLDAECRQWGWDDATGHGVVTESGDPAELAERLAPWVEAGADAVVLQPMQHEPDVIAYVELAAQVGEVLQ